MHPSSKYGRYQGYPYTNPHVIDVPTVDPVTASRWTNLPRRQISVPTSSRNEPSTSRMALPIKPEPDENPVVYIDLPEVGGNDVTEREERPQNNQTPDPSTSPSTPLAKADPEDTPVVYIDMPEDGDSEVSQRDERIEEPQFVQETIYYDPFENRRIVAKASTVGSNNSCNSGSDDGADSSRRIPPPRPPRPQVLDLTGPGAGASSSSPSPASTISPQAPDTYTRPLPESTLPPSLPITGFREPPPAYTEFELPTPSPVVDQPRPQLPQTQVILPAPSIHNLNRKYLKCQHCGVQVHTLVVKEVGFITHMSALLCLLVCMVPCVVLIYYMDIFKNRNHLCPNCNKVIGYELPMSTKKVMYVH